MFFDCLYEKLHIVSASSVHRLGDCGVEDEGAKQATVNVLCLVRHDVPNYIVHVFVFNNFLTTSRDSEVVRRSCSKQEFADEVVGKLWSSVRTDLIGSTEPAEVFEETAASVNSCGGFTVVQLRPS